MTVALIQRGNAALARYASVVRRAEGEQREHLVEGLEELVGRAERYLEETRNDPSRWKPFERGGL